MIHEAVISGACGESVGVRKIVLASAPELVTWEVTTPDTLGDTVVFVMSELVSAPGLMAVDSSLSLLLWEAFGVFLETGVSVHAEWSHEVVVSVLPVKTVIIGTMEMSSFPG